LGKRWPGPKLGLSPAYGNYYGGERPNVDYDAKVSKSPIWVNNKIEEIVPISALRQNFRDKKDIQTYNDYR
jgi:hypothetical protein